MKIVYMRSNPINPYPRAEKAINSSIEFGHKPIALAWDRKVEKFKIKEERLRLDNGDVPIYRFNIKANFGSGMSNLKPLIKWQLELLKWLIKNRKSYDLIHAYDFDTVLTALFMKKLFNKKYVYDICDFYVDAFSVPKKLKKLIKKLDFIAIKNAETTILVNEIRVKQIDGSKPKKLEFIHNTPKDIKIYTDVKNTNNSRKRIFYGGILSDGRMILETISICSRHPEWEFTIAGYGYLEDECRKKSEEIENINFIGKIEYSEVIKNTLYSDIVFACYDPKVPNHKFSSPNKVYEAMMCKKPIIVCNGTGVDKLVLEENIGITCDFEENSLEESFEYILNNKLDYEIKSNNAFNLYNQTYKWSVMKERLKKVYEDIEFSK